MPLPSAILAQLVDGWMEGEVSNLEYRVYVPYYKQ